MKTHKPQTTKSRRQFCMLTTQPKTTTASQCLRKTFKLLAAKQTASSALKCKSSIRKKPPKSKLSSHKKTTSQTNLMQSYRRLFTTRRCRLTTRQQSSTTLKTQAGLSMCKTCRLLGIHSISIKTQQQHRKTLTLFLYRKST